MKNLTSPQLAELRIHLQRSGATPGQTSTLLPLLAQEVEHYMWIGLPFDSALHKVQLEADYNPVTYLRHKHEDALVMTEEELDQMSLDDIVFADRNKAYGAYDLRRAYNRALINAFLMSVGIVLLLLSALNAWQQGKWVYVSWGGLAWVAGVLLVGFAGFRFYVENLSQREE